MYERIDAESLVKTTMIKISLFSLKKIFVMNVSVIVIKFKKIPVSICNKQILLKC